MTLARTASWAIVLGPRTRSASATTAAGSGGRGQYVIGFAKQLDEKQDRTPSDEYCDRDKGSVEGVARSPATCEHKVQSERNGGPESDEDANDWCSQRIESGEEHRADERDGERNDRIRSESFAEERNGEQRRKDGVERCDKARDRGTGEAHTDIQRRRECHAAKEPEHSKLAGLSAGQHPVAGP